MRPARDTLPLVVGAGVLKYSTNVKTSLDRGKHDCARRSAHSDTGRCHGISPPLQPAWEELTMTDKTKTQDWSEAFWYRGKVTRRRLIGYGSAAAGALGARLPVPAPWP